MARVNLRQLSRQYFRGVIDKAEYRQRRMELIESILNMDSGSAQATGPNTDVADDEDAGVDTEVPPGSTRDNR